MSNMSRELNVTPMLDVMLVLIIIFIFLAQQFILNQDVQIHDPNARGPGAQPGASYRDVFHALDAARTAGARVLGLANKR